MIRVLLAEDQAMVRGALAALLSREQDIEVVAEVARGDAVVDSCTSDRTRMSRCLILKCPGGDGLDCRTSIALSSAILSRRDPDHLWTQRLSAPGDGQRSCRISAQRCASLGTGERHCGG